jgi:hypothetical protein
MSHKSPDTLSAASFETLSVHCEELNGTTLPSVVSYAILFGSKIQTNK